MPRGSIAFGNEVDHELIDFNKRQKLIKKTRIKHCLNRSDTKKLRQEIKADLCKLDGIIMRANKNRSYINSLLDELE